MRGYRRQLRWAWFFAAVLLAALPVEAADDSVPASGTLTPVEFDPFAPQADPFAPVDSPVPDWDLVAERVDRARYSACLSLTAMAAQGPRLLGPRSKFVESPAPYAEAYVTLTERILKLLDKHCGESGQ